MIIFLKTIYDHFELNFKCLNIFKFNSHKKHHFIINLFCCYLIFHYIQGDDHTYQPSPTDIKSYRSWISTEDMDGVVDAEEYLLPNKRFFNQSQQPESQCHNSAVSIS